MSQSEVCWVEIQIQWIRFKVLKTSKKNFWILKEISWATKSFGRKNSQQRFPSVNQMIALRSLWFLRLFQFSSWLFTQHFKAFIESSLRTFHELFFPPSFISSFTDLYQPVKKCLFISQKAWLYYLSEFDREIESWITMRRPIAKP